VQPVTPRGFRDVLFEEAREREAVVAAISRTLSAWGYDPVVTPAVEDYKLLDVAMGPDLEGTAFRLIDVDGSLLALRPEMTVPVARVVASRLAGAAGPHRIRYVADVFREHASLRGQAREFSQVGIELVGAHGPTADAEVVLLLVDCLEAAGLVEFSVGVGTVQVLAALLASAGGPEAWTAAVTAAAHARNLVELDRLAARDDLAPEVAAALREVPRLRGGGEALRRCSELVEACGCGSALDDLSETWSTLQAVETGGRVTLDFGLMRSFGYYTGLQLEAYAPGLGLPLGGGGRYDRLLASLGAPAPAAGFALGLERVMIALAEQDRTPRPDGLDAVLGGEDAPALFTAAALLRAAGWRVRLAPGRLGTALVREADRCGAAEALLATDGGIARVDRAGERVGALAEPLPQPPRLTWAAETGEEQ